MRLNDLKPAEGAHRDAKRVARGPGSGTGKTAGRGHKGARSRSGGGPKAGFEGSQMPLQRRLPKFGFSSRTANLNAEVRLDALAKISAERIDMDILKAAKIVPARVQNVKVILAGEITKAVKLKGIAVTKGARAAIEAAGGSIEDADRG